MNSAKVKLLVFTIIIVCLRILYISRHPIGWFTGCWGGEGECGCEVNAEMNKIN